MFHKLKYFMKQLLHFAYQQAMSCIFPVAMFMALGLSKFVHVPYLHRYDLILLFSILVQFLMVITRLESIDELKVIMMFHVIGIGLEIYKVHTGSWSYPEAALTKIFGVPLYSGFMYSSVASYMVQAWRRLDIEVFMWPKPIYAVALSVAIYLNFFTDHFMYDFRWILTVLLFIVFFKTSIRYVVHGEIYYMPMTLAYFLIAFFIWIAENISTILGGYVYPNQAHTWHMVQWGKISSWFLLVVISSIIVAQLKQVKAGLQKDKGIIREASVKR